MNSTFFGYILFGIATYVFLVSDEHMYTVLSKEYFPEVLIKYIHIPGFIFVTTGVYASIFISYSFREVFAAVKSLYMVFIKNKIDFRNYIDTIHGISEYAQTRDIETLEEYANSIKYPFLRDGLLMLVNGYKKDDIKEMLTARMETELNREEVDDDVWRAAARYSPGYGMLGTTVGLIQMFTAGVDPQKGFAPIIAAMGVAFTTTLYGLAYSNFIYQPFADKIERRNQEDFILKALIMDGLLMIIDKRRPAYVEEKLMSYIPTRRTMSTIKMQILEGTKK